MTDGRSWSIEHEVRDDADSVFVPASLLPTAEAGDAVELRSAEPGEVRTGRVVERIDDDVRGSFVTVELDAR